jgi:hypothetical protein
MRKQTTIKCIWGVLQNHYIDKGFTKKLGSCKLGRLKNNKSPNPKSPYLNTKMEKKSYKPMSSGPYVMIN